MGEEKSLDLSQVSVANLLNDEAPSNIPEPETETVEEAVAEPQVEEPVQEDTTVEEPVAEAGTEVDEVDTEPVSEETSEQTGDDTSVIDVLRSKFGYEVEGDFEEDYDGVVAFTQTVANEIAKEQLDSVFGQYPDVEQYLQYRYNGGDPKKYFQATAPQVDYGSIDIDAEDVGTQRAVVQEFLRRNGYTDDEAKETVQEYVDAGILERHATRSLGKLKTMQEREAATIMEQQQKEAQARQHQVQEQWTNIKSTIDTGRVRDFEIPAADRKKFFGWMSEAVDNQGNTQRLIDRQSMNIETQVAMEYLLWKNFDLNKLVANSANTAKAQNLKQKLQRNNTAAKRMKGGQTSYKAPKKLPSLKDLL